MVAAADLIKAILQEDVVQASEAPIEADESQDALFATNNYMFELAADGINLGFTELTGLADEVTVPRGAINAIVKNVSIQIARQYGSVVSQEQAALAANGLRVLEKLAIQIPSTPYPDTLPIGTGNECGINNHFYGESEATIETETGLVIVPESNTELP